MARCGCASSCACVVQADPNSPITVTGNGSVQNPYVVGISVDGLTGCDAISACVSRNLGPGLTWDAASRQIQVKLSTDTGQTARFGSDQGVLVTTGGPPIPETCLHGIDSLPAAPGVLAAKSLAGLHGPYSSPYSLDYCLAHQMDIVHFQVATSADDVGVVSDYWDDRITGGHTSIYVGQDIRQLNASTVKSAYNYAGNVDDPISYQRPDPDDPATRGDRQGGWYGWLAQRYHQPLASDFLARINGKAVALMACYPQPGVAFGTETTHVRGAIRAALDHCAQNWAMIGVQALENATTVINAGLVPILTPNGPGGASGGPEQWGTTTPPYPVADVTGAGVEWVVLSDFYADSVFQEYVGAGLQVLMMGNSRQAEKARAAALGVRGYMAMDPVYYRGVDNDEGYGYRSETDAWEHRRMATGQLTFRTDHQDVVSDGGFVRGHTEEAEQGLVLPANFGEGVGRASVLCGWECPLTNATDYTITWAMKATSLPSPMSGVAKMGLLFGAETDADTYAWPEGDPDVNPMGLPRGQQTLYRAYQRVTGEIGIAKWDSPTSAIAYLATMDSPALTVGTWSDYTLTVTPGQITFTRTVSNGTTYTATTDDTQYRGAYFFIEKEESFEGEDPHPFAAKFRDVTYTPAG